MRQSDKSITKIVSLCVCIKVVLFDSIIKRYYSSFCFGRWHGSSSQLCKILAK
jgi:hypothetical protein